MSSKNHPSDERNDSSDLEVVFHPDKAVEKELKAVPERHRDRFNISLALMGKRLAPTCKIKQLHAIDREVYELIINASPGPAWRLIYYVGDKGKIVVLHVTDKTTEGSDRQIAKTAELRLKAWRGTQKQAKYG
jgi:phage-related protein